MKSKKNGLKFGKFKKCMLYLHSSLKGIVFEAAEDGQSGKIVALKDCTVGGTETGSGSRQYYTYEWTTISDIEILDTQYPVYSTTDGAANMEVVKNNLDLFPAFKACAQMEGAAWYLPASAELATLFSNKGSYLLALRDNGGSDLSAKGYWSSTLEGSTWSMSILYYNQAKPVGINQMDFDSITENQAVRAIAKFEEK